MIINFNFNISKVEFIWQQNNNKYFAVNFLMDSASKRDFKAIINEVMSSNEELKQILQNQSQNQKLRLRKKLSQKWKKNHKLKK